MALAQGQRDGPVTLDTGGIDLSGTVTHLNRVKSKNRARLANSDLTRAFLDAAISLTDPLVDGGEAAAEEARQVLAHLSRPRIVGRVQEEHPELVATEAKFRDRWAGQQDFLSDFVAYALVAREFALRQAIETWAEELVRDRGGFAGAIQRVASEGTHFIATQRAFRLQILIAAAADSDPESAEALRHLYEALTNAWFGLYEHVVERFGLRLRRGVRPEEVCVVLQALTEGLGLRMLAGADAPQPRGRHIHTVLGTAGLAIFSSLVDTGDGLSLEEYANRQFTASIQNWSGAGGIPPEDL
ncbi:hypothetical protein [Sinomonas halotolerans]|uniref:Uncharacterized protein n=1 Tax=Sinomonas halotolerans TaxID=1644133 RepID=A0ABU9WYQ8_9MICC